MEDAALSTPKRRFAGRPGSGRRRGDDFDVLAKVLFPAASEPQDLVPARPGPSAPKVSRGLYVLDAGGIDPGLRRRTALAAAAYLAPRSRAAAVFIFTESHASAHVVGEPACGRVGPQNYLNAPDLGRTVDGLVGQCDQVGLVLLDGAEGLLAPAERAAERVVFLATPDAESLVETYRGMKRWHAAGARALGAIFVLEPGGNGRVERIFGRLRSASEAFLGEPITMLGTMAPGTAGPGGPEPMAVFADLPAADVWRHVLAAAARDPASPGRSPAMPGRSAAAGGPPVAPVPPSCEPATERPLPPTAGRALVSLWQPEEAEALLGAVEAQVPALLGERFRAVFRVDVDEPGAPALAAVRDDGALVAVLIAEDGAPVDTQAAERWLCVHRSLLVRALPSGGISAAAAPSVIVLAPLKVPPAADGVRRFLPVRCGGRRGVVLLP